MKITRKAVSEIMLALLFIGMLTFAFNIQPTGADQMPCPLYVPYVPDPRGVDIVFWTANQKAYVNVTITFGDPCVNISYWGTVTKADYDIWLDSKIWDWTGYCIQIICSVSHTYELGCLEPGNYTFTFKAWGRDVKSINFTVAGVISEFPSAMILPLAMILSIIAVIFAKRRLPRKPKN